MNKKLFILLFTMLGLFSYGQGIEMTIDTPLPICNSGECTQLNANYKKTQPTGTYAVQSIPYNPAHSFTDGIKLPIDRDDKWTEVFDLPFSFCFYGKYYNKILIGSNGVLTFDIQGVVSGGVQVPGGNCEWEFSSTIPSTNFPIKNAIYGVYQDIDIERVQDFSVQNVNYYVRGVTPNRVFVLNSNEIPLYQCLSEQPLQTYQIVLYETTNVIDVIVKRRDVCNSWQNGRGVIGIMNQAGTQAVVPPGRNTGNWTTTNEAWRFTPSEAVPSNTVLTWLANGSPIPASTDVNPLTVCPTTSTVYTAIATYTQCDGSTVVVQDTETVAPEEPLPVLDPQNISICSTSSAPHSFNINQNLYMLNGASVLDYSFTYHVGSATGPIIPETDLNQYSSAGNGEEIWVEIGDLNTTGCINFRKFTLTAIAPPSGTFNYTGTNLCSNETNPQLPVLNNLTSGGTYSASPVGLTINANTGAITPSTSTLGNTYTITYSIPVIGNCPAYQTQTTVTINESNAPVINCGDSTTVSVSFNWAAVTAATAYTVSYQVNNTPITNIGSIGNNLTYTVNSLSPNDSVTITVTPTGAATACFSSNSFICRAINCDLATATISYSTPFCITETTPKSVTITGTGNYTGGTFSAPEGLTINATTGEITLNTSTAGTYIVTYSIPSPATGCPVVTAQTTVVINQQPNAGRDGEITACETSTNAINLFTALQDAQTNGVWQQILGNGGIFNAANGTFTPALNASAINTFSYTITGIAPCIADTSIVTVNLIRSPRITGNFTTCVGASNQLSSVSTPNTTNPWTSSDTAVATIDSTGNYTGITAGTSVITFTDNNGCSATQTITIIGIPVINGNNSVCIGSTTTLSSTSQPDLITPWISSNTSIATINSQGVVTGVSVGTVNITYVNINGCSNVLSLEVNELPTISGTFNVCEGQTVQLTGSGTANTTSPWSSSNPSVATINNTGLVTAISQGTTTITYKNNKDCIITQVVNVNGLPTISGEQSICIGLSSQLTGSGTPSSNTPWVSSNLNIATINTNGLISAISNGTTDITYTNSLGCSKTIRITINNLPTISGNLTPCEGESSQLTGSGTPNTASPWISSNPSVATVSNTGLVRAITSGTTDITFTNSINCSKTVRLNVNITPTITGTLEACVGNTTQLLGSGIANITTPWISSDTSIATVSSNGLVTGISTGTVTITYTASNGCTATVTVTILALPNINGETSICLGNTSQLNGSGVADVITPWISSNPNVATVNNNGLVTSVSVGTTTITYRNIKGCIKNTTITVNPLPSISGNTIVCKGLTSQLIGSGTPSTNNPWISSNTAVATIDSNGLLTTISAGNTVITYTNNIGCKITQTITVNELPSITGNLEICIGLNSQLNGNGTPSSINPWTSSNPAIATVNNIGLVTAVSVGTSIISYTNTNGCIKTVTVSVNPLPVITGNLSVCNGLTNQLTGDGIPNTTNPWISSNTAVATVNTSGLITALFPGTSTITYTNNNGCQNTITVTVLPLPTITGNNVVCAGATIQLIGSGTLNPNTLWSSSNPTVATVNNSGLVSGVSAGTTVITYSNNNGCIITKLITVIAKPIITGNQSVCIGSTTQLSSTSFPNVSLPWVSSNASVATINSSGLVSAVNVGTTNITFINSNGCSNTITLTVNPLPTITGNFRICKGLSSQLIGSGTANNNNPWTSSNSAVAMVSNTGLVTAISEGNTVITYTNNNGCSITQMITIYPLPTISGALILCERLTSQLTASDMPNTNSPWISSNTNIATINNNGLVTAISPGSTNITYTNSNGCIKVVTITVNSLPTISGNLIVCKNFTTTLTSTHTPNSNNPWTSSNINVATINNNGIVTGVSPGTSIITFTNNNGCIITTTLTVNDTPQEPVTTNVLRYCQNDTTVTALSAVGTNLLWYSFLNGVGSTTAPTPNTSIPGVTNYYVSQSLGGCEGPKTKITVTIIATPLPSLTGGNICLDKDGKPLEGLLLDTGLNNVDYNFEWSNISTTPPTPITNNSSSYLATTPGTYSVVATSITLPTNTTTPCTSSPVSAVVTSSSVPFSFQAIPSNYFEDLQTITVTNVLPTNNGGYEYQIDNQGFQNSNVFYNVGPGEHLIEVRDAKHCGIVSQTANILDYPKFFTPNGDGFNDTWNIHFPDDKNQLDSKITIFDRYGKLLKQIKPYGPGWDGTHNGFDLPATDYWFILNYIENGEQKTLKRHFALKR